MPTRVVVSAGNKRLLNGKAQSDYKKTRTKCDCQRQKQWIQWDAPEGDKYLTKKTTCIEFTNNSRTQRKSPSPFGYSLFIKRESCRARVGGVCKQLRLGQLGSSDTTSSNIISFLNCRKCCYQADHKGTVFQFNKM